MSNLADDIITLYEFITGKELLPFQKDAVKVIMSDKKFKFNTRGRKY